LEGINMSRIKSVLGAAKANGRTALIPYITAGDPNPDITVSLMHALVAGGADIIELGVPFSDPMADGPVIQLACERALAHGTSLRNILAMVAKFREQNTETPLVLMGYLNPVEAMGYDVFASEAAKVGVDGVLIVDLPPEEAGEMAQLFEAAQLDSIFLLAPTSDAGRIKSICEVSTGYIYYVSVKGVTGSASLDVESVKTKLEEIRTYTDLPLGVGFGIKDAASAAAVGKYADGVIVGSALVNIIAANAKSPELIANKLTALLQEMRQALDAS
jgi:tryptophan synthase alpha chain